MIYIISNAGTKESGFSSVINIFICHFPSRVPHCHSCYCFPYFASFYFSVSDSGFSSESVSVSASSSSSLFVRFALSAILMDFFSPDGALFP